MLRFDTTAQWQEKHKFLKWEVPLEIFSSEAFYETQYGYISRPTHRNTTWDAAKFEVSQGSRPFSEIENADRSPSRCVAISISI